MSEKNNSIVSNVVYHIVDEGIHLFFGKTTSSEETNFQTKELLFNSFATIDTKMGKIKSITIPETVIGVHLNDTIGTVNGLHPLQFSTTYDLETDCLIISFSSQKQNIKTVEDTNLDIIFNVTNNRIVGLEILFVKNVVNLS